MLAVTFILAPNRNVSFKIGTDDISRSHIKTLRIEDISKEEIMEALDSVPLTVQERIDYTSLLKEFLDKI